MGKARQNTNTTKTHKLEEKDWKFLKVLNFALQLHVMKDQIITGYLIIICNKQFGYDENVNLTFEIDLGSDTQEMKVTEVSNEEVAAHMAEGRKA
jgi:hypothetical protein